MKIIVCIGNPGARYRRNRHNAGFLIGEYFSRIYNITPKKKEFSALTGHGEIEHEKFFMLFPQTFVNNSGKSAKAALDYFRESPENMLVIHDEIELPFGEYRKKFGGGHKGHNGLRSIIQHAGTPDFYRLRFGVGRPSFPDMPVADYLLSDFSDDEMSKIEIILPGIMDPITDFIKPADH